MFRSASLSLLLTFALASLGYAQDNSPIPPPIKSDSPAANSPPAASDSNIPQVDPAVALLYAAVSYLEENQFDTAIERVNSALKLKPNYANAYGLRAAIYAKKQDYVRAEQDFQSELQLDSSNSQVRLNLAEIQFKQKKYDVARPNFVALHHDIILDDFADYKTFLCDLFGGHEDVAAKELAVFNQAGRNASYHFGNIAWSLYHKKNDEARDWLATAAAIYAPTKFNLYTTSLHDLGYLPLPDPTPANPPGVPPK